MQFSCIFTLKREYEAVRKCIYDTFIALVIF